MVSTKQVTNASKEPKVERKDKHVRGRVETKETPRGLHGVECIEIAWNSRLESRSGRWQLRRATTIQLTGHTAPVL
jgi:hypothetical protein